MAFKNKNLSIAAYANSWTLWHYKADISNTGVIGDGYFDSVKSLMNTGDLIIIQQADTTSIKVCVVSSGGVALKALAK